MGEGSFGTRVDGLEDITDLLNTNKQVVISTPYDPVHLTHVGFNSDTGECEFSEWCYGSWLVRLKMSRSIVIVTGLPKEWQQTLQDNGVTRQEQEKNPEAVSCGHPSSDGRKSP